jgi:hypothetical protein
VSSYLSIYWTLIDSLAEVDSAYPLPVVSLLRFSSISSIDRSQSSVAEWYLGARARLDTIFASMPPTLKDKFLESSR